MDFNTFLLWAINAGGNVIICSWLLERFGWYQAQSSNKKQWIFFGASSVIAILAYCVLNFVPVDVFEVIKPIFGIIYVTFTNVFLGSVFHKLDKEEIKG